MRLFQMLIAVLLTAITIELGLLVVKSPMPTIQAQTQTPTPPAMQDPHDVLKAQIAALDRRLSAMEQQNTDIAQTMRGAAAVMGGTCRMVSQIWTKVGLGANPFPRSYTDPCVVIHR